MRRLFSLLLTLLALAGLTACGGGAGGGDDPAADTAVRTVTDSYGRTVEIPETVETVVCTGSGALRMVCYLQCTDRLAGVEDTDKTYGTSPLRDYAYVYHDLLAGLPSIGKGGGTANTA